MIANKHSFVRLGVILIGLYVLSWVLFGLDNLYVRSAIKSHYGATVAVSVCYGSGALNGNKQEVINTVQFGEYSDESKTPITPFLMPMTRFSYSRTYSRNGRPWEVGGSIDFLGHIHESYNHVYNNFACPICLSSGTMIDTDRGQQRVTSLKVGNHVWSKDGKGQKILVSITKTGRRAVPAGTILLHVTVADGRNLLVSPSHPTADGTYFKDLKVGGLLDRSRIVSIAKDSYDEGYTYDILPQSSTATYWANGVLVGSTLKQ